jgi:NADPH:quinone reductase-like Zn-dependent oxidoreductase
VEAVGRSVQGLEPGDAVFGRSSTGTLAEYTRAPADNFAPKPVNLSMEQAAAIPVSAFTAPQALREIARVQPGQTVLITGASGGVGTFAVQIAKAFGAEVTGACSTPNVDLVRSLGADHLIDYTRTDFTRTGQRYEVILDNVEAQSLSAARRALTPTGTLIPNNGHIFAESGHRSRGARLGCDANNPAAESHLSVQARPAQVAGVPATGITDVNTVLVIADANEPVALTEPAGAFH